MTDNVNQTVCDIIVDPFTDTELLVSNIETSKASTKAWAYLLKDPPNTALS
jgi:hypothetical protein